MRRFSCVVVLCGLALAPGAWAADADDQPVAAASAATAVADGPPPDPEAEARRSREISAALEQFENSVATLEGEQGPFDPSLIEVLLDYARYQGELGQHAAAAELFERALAITRISHGLRSSEQVLVLQGLIDAHMAAGNWALADDRAHLAFYLQKRLHAADSPEYVAALLQYGQFKQQVFGGNRLSRSALASIRDIEELQTLYSDVLFPSARDIAAAGGPPPRILDSRERFELLHARAVTEFQLAQFAMHSVPLGLDRPVERYISEFVCRDVVGQNGQVAQQCGTVRRENPAYRDWEMQRQMYSDRIRYAVSSLEESVRAAQVVLEENPALLLGDNAVSASRMQDLQAMQQRAERDYRRSRMDW